MFYFVWNFFTISRVCLCCTLVCPAFFLFNVCVSSMFILSHIFPVLRLSFTKFVFVLCLSCTTFVPVPRLSQSYFCLCPTFVLEHVCLGTRLSRNMFVLYHVCFVLCLSCTTFVSVLLLSLFYFCLCPTFVSPMIILSHIFPVLRLSFTKFVFVLYLSCTTFVSVHVCPVPRLFPSYVCHVPRLSLSEFFCSTFYRPTFILEPIKKNVLSAKFPPECFFSKCWILKVFFIVSAT